MKKIKLFEEDIKRALENPDEGYKELGRAKNYILHEYKKTLRDLETDSLVIDEILWEENYQTALDYMREAGLKEFIITNKSTELMDLLHFFTSQGCQLKGPETVERKVEYPWGKDIKGLRLAI